MSDDVTITDDDIRDVVRWLDEALEEAEAEARHERVGRAVRALTRLWASANPDFDGEAFYAVSYMLTEHREQISRQMSELGAG